MFARLFAVASLAALAVASNPHLTARGQCTTGVINCCESTMQTSDLHSALSQIGLANLIADVTGFSGTGCSPTGLVGVGGSGASCTQKPLCCDHNLFEGISVGCSPISIGL